MKSVRIDSAVLKRIVEVTNLSIGILICSIGKRNLYIRHAAPTPSSGIAQQSDLISMLQANLQIEGNTYSDWLVEHFKQASRMLPTGLCCGGIYITEVPQALIESKSGSSKVLLALLNDIASTLGISELVLLTTHQGKVSCGFKDSVRLVQTEIKASAMPDLQQIRCLIPINIGATSEQSSMKETYNRLMKEWVRQLNHIKIDFTKSEVEVYSKAFGSISQSGAPFLRICGVFEAVVVHPGSSTDKLLNLVKTDLVRSLKDRLEIMAETREILTTFPQSLKVPRRIVHACGSETFCDYALSTETEEASVARIAALLASEPKTSTCREYCEIQSPSEQQVIVPNQTQKWKVAGACLILLMLLWLL